MRLRFVSSAILSLLAISLVACSEDALLMSDPGPRGPELSTDLRSNYFNWPNEPFSYQNQAPIEAYLDVGDLAVDFTLFDLDGNSHNLSDLLAEKPVVLITGSFTCPWYKIVTEELNVLAQEPLGENSTYADAVHFVHVYVVEAHPEAPDVAPNYGEAIEVNFEQLPQARTYPARVENARVMSELLDPSQLLLVDDLAPGLNNPVWCTYGTGANTGFYIDTEGVVQIAQDWADVADLKKMITRLSQNR